MLHLLHGDCLQEVPKLNNNSISLIFACLPKAGEGEINPNQLFQISQNVMKNSATIVVLVPNLKIGANLIQASCESRFQFRGEQIWNKPQGTGPLSIRWRPLKKHEVLLIFQDAPKKSTYNLQMTAGLPYSGYEAGAGQTIGAQYGTQPSRHRNNPSGTRFPTTILNFPQNRNLRHLHNDGQPTAMAQHFIKTYTNPGDAVLDPCMGSGTTGVAALELGRSFFGVELEENYFKIAQKRLTSCERRV